jgi:copper(I)-binding protein
MARVFASLLIFVLCLSASAQTQSPVHVTDAWVRATVAAQRATGAFMKLKSMETMQLVGVRTPVAALAEIHSMRLNSNDVMEMRAIPSLSLTAGTVTELRPGSFHIMLMQLKAPIQTGQKVPLTLILEDARRRRHEVTIEALARPLNASARQSGTLP